MFAYMISFVEFSALIVYSGNSLLLIMAGSRDYLLIDVYRLAIVANKIK